MALLTLSDFTHPMPSDAMGAQPDPVEVLGVYAQKSAPANVVILGAGSFIWCGAQL